MPALPLPAAHRAHLWLFDLDAPAAEVAAHHATLDGSERARADRFRFARDRTAYVIAHGRLRALLGAHLGHAAADVRLTHGEGRKPVLTDRPDLHFSLSHSGAIGMVGLAAIAIGVDVEVIRDVPERDAIIAREFAPAEVAALSALPAAARQPAFFACWTQKEAYVKAIGLGLALPLTRFAVRIGEPAGLLEVDGDPGEACRWSLWSRPLGTRAFAAAACRDPALTYELADLRGRPATTAAEAIAPGGVATGR